MRRGHAIAGQWQEPAGMPPSPLCRVASGADVSSRAGRGWHGPRRRPWLRNRPGMPGRRSRWPARGPRSPGGRWATRTGPPGSGPRLGIEGQRGVRARTSPYRHRGRNPVCVTTMVPSPNGEQSIQTRSAADQLTTIGFSPHRLQAANGEASTLGTRQGPSNPESDTLLVVFQPAGSR